MKIISILLLILSLGAQAKVITLPKTPDGGIYNPNLAPYNILPGDTILFEGDYSYIYLTGVKSPAGQPRIRILNKGLVRIGLRNSNSMIFYESYGFIVDGSGTPGINYGFQFGPEKKGPLDPYNSQGLTVYNSSEYEVKNVEVVHCQVGIFGNPIVGGPMKNIKIHDNYIHDINNPSEQGRCEAMYLGNTNLYVVNQPAHFENIEIYNNLCENLYGDGIQLANAQGYKIYGNTVSGYGKAKLMWQMTGILIGGNSKGSVSNNIIKDGTGTAIQVFGYDYNLIEGNKIDRTSTEPNNDAIYIEKKGGTDGTQLQVDCVNNVIDGAARTGIRNACTTATGKPGVWKGNTIINAVAGKYHSSIGDVITEGTVVTPPPVIKKKMQINENFTWEWVN